MSSYPSDFVIFKYGSILSKGCVDEMKAKHKAYIKDLILIYLFLDKLMAIIPFTPDIFIAWFVLMK